MKFIKANTILALTLCITASCTKIQQGGFNDADLQISYDVISSKETVKSSAYPEASSFISYAWYLPNGSNWATNKASAQLYIKDATISYQSGKWYDNSKSYYWPKAGSLSFLSYSPSSIKSYVIVDNSLGVQIKDYNVHNNQDKDIMIADIAADKTASLSEVPTVFRHKLTMIDGFTINTIKPYNEYNFTLKSIIIHNVKQIGSYASGAETGATRPGLWTVKADGELYDYTWFSGSQTVDKDISTAEKVNATGLGGKNYLYLLPQTFTNPGTPGWTSSERETIPHLEINYTRGSTSVTTRVALYNVFNAGGNRLEMNKKITINLTISNEGRLIFWAPDYDDWTQSGYDIDI